MTLLPLVYNLMKLIVQCIECDRLFTATRRENNTLYVVDSMGCPQCGGTDVTVITE